MTSSYIVGLQQQNVIYNIRDLSSVFERILAGEKEKDRRDIYHTGLSRVSDWVLVFEREREREREREKERERVCVCARVCVCV